MRRWKVDSIGEVILPSRRSRRNALRKRAAVWSGCVLVSALSVLATPALPATRIDLPTPADLVSADLPILQPRAGESEESRVPGPVSDDETVRVTLQPDGAIDAVTIDQTLTLQGVGDFDIVLPGPATHIVGPTDQSIQPGLRRGEILWNGFSPGTKTLRSTVTMDPQFELFHLPLTFSIRYLQGGRIVQPPLNGLVTIEIRVSNTTGRDIVMKDAVPDRRDLAELLDGLRKEIAAGRRPVAGERGVPRSVDAMSAVDRLTEQVMIPMSISGTINFPRSSFAVADVAGALFVRQGPAGAAVALNAQLPSRRFADGSAIVRISGVATSLARMDLNLHATGELPQAGELDPPSGATWRASLANASAARLRDAFTLAQRTIWQVLLLPETDAHLGNPGKGLSRSVFSFASAAPAAPPKLVAVEKVRPGAIALALVAMILVIGNAVVLWTKS
jgi:hypothetical protein